jgi:hypothetical protein
MPETIPDLYFLSTSALGVVGIGVIAWLVKRGLAQVDGNLSSIDAKIDSLSHELQQERRDRIEYYGEIRAELAAQKAVCDERHRARAA